MTQCGIEAAACGPLYIMCSFLAQQNYSWGFELRHRLSKFHEHVTLLPRLAQVIRLVGWPKLVKFFFFFIQRVVEHRGRGST